MLRLCTILTGMHGSHSISGWDNVNTVTGRDEKFGPREVGQMHLWASAFSHLLLPVLGALGPLPSVTYMRLQIMNWLNMMTG